MGTQYFYNATVCIYGERFECVVGYFKIRFPCEEYIPFFFAENQRIPNRRRSIEPNFGAVGKQNLIHAAFGRTESSVLKWAIEAGLCRFIKDTSVFYFSDFNTSFVS